MHFVPNIKTFLQLFFLLITVQSALAQNGLYEIRGYILDSESEYGISGVHVIDSLNAQATISDQSGYFEIYSSDSSSITFSHIAYKKEHIPFTLFDKDSLNAIEMDIIVEELDEVILREGDFDKFKKDFLALPRDSFESNVEMPSVNQYKGPIKLKPGGDGSSGNPISGTLGTIINPMRREQKRVKRWMKKIKKRQEK